MDRCNLHFTLPLLATAEAKDRRVTTGYHAKPTNYTSTGVSVGGGGGEARSPIEWQPVTPQSSSIDGGATDSCFTLIGAHQCSVVVFDVG